MDVAQIVVLAVAAAIAGIFGGKYWERKRAGERRHEARSSARAILEDAEEEAERLRKEAELDGRKRARKFREELEEELEEREESLTRSEKRVTQREELVDRKLALLDEREERQESQGEELEERQTALNRRAEELEEREESLERREEQLEERLERIAGLTAEEARESIREKIEDQARAEASSTVRKMKEEARREAERESKRIITMAIQKLAVDHSSDVLVSVVSLPSDDMKGRIIGREGRNIRAFEAATGVDVVVDDTPEAVLLSCFDPIRREVARMAMERLVADGRIHPGRIEEMVSKARDDVDEGMRDAAEELLYELGIHDLHPQLVEMLGRLKFRTSYGQNQLQHAREVALLAGSMAAELELDVDTAKRAGLLHDVGKGLTHEREGSHVELGYELCKRHGEHEIVLNSIRAHHGEEPARFPETFLVMAADAISGARPGARRESFEHYVKRLEKLEEIAASYAGVDKVFAIQAGREIRIMVSPDSVSDEEMTELSERTARRIEEELQYPGQIKVVVVRESRSVDFAR